MTVNFTKNPNSIISIFLAMLRHLYDKFKIQSFKVGKNDNNYVSKVLEAALLVQYKTSLVT